MNVFLWVLQGLLAFHTLAGALWKFSHSPEQTMPSLAPIPPAAWLVMSIVEILCALALVLPAVQKRLAGMIPIAALVIAAEMLLYSGLHLSSGHRDIGPVVYWLVVAAFCGFVAVARRRVRT